MSLASSSGHRFRLRAQSPQAEIVYHIFYLLDLYHVIGKQMPHIYGQDETYAIFDPITPPPQYIILEVKKLEASMDILEEFADLERPCVIAEGDRVGGEPCL